MGKLNKNIQMVGSLRLKLRISVSDAIPCRRTNTINNTGISAIETRRDQADGALSIEDGPGRRK